MARAVFVTDERTIMESMTESVLAQALELERQKKALIEGRDGMGEAVLLHMARIRKELPDARFRFHREEGNLVFEVYSPSIHGNHMAKHSFRTAVNALERWFGIEVRAGYPRRG